LQSIFTKDNERFRNAVVETGSQFSVIPLPPTATQDRIIEKHDRLMAQCDALEASLKAAATVSERWSAAAVRQLLEDGNGNNAELVNLDANAEGR
jgi:hypothetical protein